MDDRLAAARFGIGRRRIVHRHHAEAAILTKLQHAEIGLAKPRRIGQYRLEHRLDLAWRA